MEKFILCLISFLLYIIEILISGLLLMMVGNNIFEFDLTFIQSVAILLCIDIIFKRPNIRINENNNN